MQDLTKSRWAGGLLALAALLLTAAPLWAEPLYPIGSRIGLEPPPGMTLNKGSNQFEDLDRKATITVLDVPIHLYSEMERMVFAETNRPGVNVLKRESFPYESGIGYFISVDLAVDGAKYRKWLLLGQSNSNPAPDLATLVSVQVPEAALEAYPDAAVRKALASVTFRAAPNEERLGLMPFKIDDLSGFEVAEVAPGGVILSDKPPRGGQPEIIVSIGKDAPLAPGDRPLFARQLMERGPVISMEIFSAEPMRIGGTPGFEIKARGLSPNGSQIVLVQWLKFTGSNYVRIVGAAAAAEWDLAYPRMRAVRDGIALR